MLDCLVLERIIKIQVYYYEGKVRVGKVVGTIGLLIIIGSLVGRGFISLVEVEKSAEIFCIVAGGQPNKVQRN